MFSRGTSVATHEAMNDGQEVPTSLLFPAIPESEEPAVREAQAEDDGVLDKYDIGTLACTD